MSKVPSPLHLACWMLILVVSVLPVAAQDANAAEIADLSDAERPGEAAFLIEAIAVTGNKHFPAEVILSESLLKEGHSYSEEQLRQAVNRIVRLPLVLDAEFFLRKGSERGRYELVVEVEEASRWFYGFDQEWTTGDRETSFDFSRDRGLIYRDDDDDFFSIGGRTAIGKNGVGAISIDALSVQLSYSHYNLIKKGVRLSFNYLLEPWDDFSDQEILRVDLGVPVRGNHSLNFSVRHTVADLSGFGSFDVSQRDTTVGVMWLYNTLNDPVLPTEGWFVRAGLDRGEFDELRFLRVGDEFDEWLFEGTRRRFLASGERHWEISDKTSVSGTTTLALIDSGDWETTEGSIELGLDRFLRRNIKKNRWRELRWENSVRFVRSDRSPPSESGFPDADVDEISLASGFTFRSRAGIVRLSLRYLDSDRPRLQW